MGDVVGLFILFGFSGVLGAFLIGLAVSIGSMIKERIEARALKAPKSARKKLLAAAGASTPVAFFTPPKTNA